MHEMGYYTQYKIHTKHSKGPEYLKDFEPYGYSFLEESKDEYVIQFEAKWYEWKDEMLEISDKFPKLLFTVDGDGEESGDNWRAFFKGGKYYIWRKDITEIRNAVQFNQSNIDALNMDDAIS